MGSDARWPGFFGAGVWSALARSEQMGHLASVQQQRRYMFLCIYMVHIYYVAVQVRKYLDIQVLT